MSLTPIQKARVSSLAGTRRSGRSSDMVRSVPSNKPSIVIAYEPANRDHLKILFRELRSDALVRVYAVRSETDALARLTGLGSALVFIDHEFVENAPRRLVDLVDELTLRVEVQP